MVVGIVVAVMVVIIVDRVSDTVTTVVDKVVTVTGGKLSGDSVTVCVESLVTICVSVGATPSGWPPSTGITE